jgi:hypothetical protein
MADSERPGTPHDVATESDEYLEAYREKYGKTYLLKNLLRFGFTPHTAAMICQSIPTELVSLQTPAYWANRYINSLSDEDSS